VKNESSPPRGGLPLDVIPFRFMVKPEDFLSISSLDEEIKKLWIANYLHENSSNFIPTLRVKLQRGKADGAPIKNHPSTSSG